MRVRVIQRALLKWSRGGDTVIIGEMRRELRDKFTVYVIDLDEAQTAEAIKKSGRNLCTLIPGLDIEDDGYYVEYQLVPYIVEMRVPDRRREDIAQICAQNNMKHYDEFTYFLNNKGFGMDEWSVEEIEI
ncbi:MAG: hypothetical protein FWG90_11145 [Oscillospiraceae bacterium]|nr:hypothetical protein [Oscillospiraceae bacterium]